MRRHVLLDKMRHIPIFLKGTMESHTAGSQDAWPSGPWLPSLGLNRVGRLVNLEPLDPRVLCGWAPFGGRQEALGLSFSSPPAHDRHHDHLN